MNENPHEVLDSTQTPILTVAWTRFAQFDAISLERSKRHLRLRKWVAALSVLATLFAILLDAYPQNFPALGGVVLQFFLVLTPISGSVLAAFVNKFYGSGDWLTLRAGAEEMLREIFTYRTILQKSSDRRQWLEKRLAEIQRQVYKGLGGEMVLKTYKGSLPPYYDPQNPDSDSGFNDLDGETYFRLRLQQQLNWHTKKVNQFQHERTRLQMLVLGAGGAGALLAALGGPLTIWVALTASLAAVFAGWEELRNLDAAVKNYSKVILELSVLHDHWKNLESEERTDTEFYTLVRYTEEILWSQNMEYIKAMQEALATAREEQEDLVMQVIRESRQADARAKEAQRMEITGNYAQQTSIAQAQVQAQYREAVGGLAEAATSDAVQEELKAMGKFVARGAAEFSDKLKQIAAQFEGLSLTKETPKETLNQVLSQYPPSGDVKG